MIYLLYNISKYDILTQDILFADINVDSTISDFERRCTMANTETPLTEAFYYILLALRKPNHGYGIIQEVEELTNGRVHLGAGTLYGALQTLEKRAWIEIYSEEESSRKKKEYIITPIGRKAFGKERERLKELVNNGKLMEE